MPQTRLIQIAPERLAGWVSRFSDVHGPLRWEGHGVSSNPEPLTDESGEGRRSTLAPSLPSLSWRVTAQDASWVELSGWRQPSGAVAPSPVEQELWARPPALLLVLVRRGGFAVAVTDPGGPSEASHPPGLAAHKVGTRHVQSRTAAGGWSQQRYARRRANQADALVGAVVEHAARVLEAGQRSVGPVEGLVLGGDRTLAETVLTGLAGLTGRRGEALAGPDGGPLDRLLGLPRRELWDLPDPRRAVLDEGVRRAVAVRARLFDVQRDASG